MNLTAGIAIMALGALAQGTALTIVPVGMNYFSAHKFRSRAVIEFGDAVTVSQSTIYDFKNGKKREAIGAVMGDISEALAAVTVSAPDFETLNVSFLRDLRSCNSHTTHSSSMPPVDYTSPRPHLTRKHNDCRWLIQPNLTDACQKDIPHTPKRLKLCP